MTDPTAASGASRRSPQGRLGVRARVTIAFALGALVLSAVLAAITYGITRDYVLRQRDRTAVRQAYLNARLVRDGLRAPDASISAILTSLETPSGSRVLLSYQDRWFSDSVDTGQGDVPGELQALVASGAPGRQRAFAEGEPHLVVGVPIPSLDAAYFEVFSLEEVDRTLDVLGASLLGAALVTTVAGGLLGLWASRRALRPLADVSAAAARVAEGELDARLHVGGDVDLEPLAESFNRMVDALQARMERDARFVSDVSHELRSPLTTLATSVELLASRRDELPERSRVAVDLLVAEIARFQRVVEDLLEISRSGSAADLHLEDVRVGELVLHAVTGSADPPFTVDIDPDVASRRLLADKRRLERILANLLDNARIHGGGVARVAVERHEPNVRIIVEDRGPGVPEEERDHVFERFFRGAVAGRRGHTEGAGLGLALVAEHTRLHGGRAWVEPGDGSGARFVVELPEAPA
ncbi:MAG: HAMP domain-containing histidine kinase [Acidimicrobiia bacterium]|nr:HAMP domain-containing histidine kinase [Acidimicrobiia bacterium]